MDCRARGEPSLLGRLERGLGSLRGLINFELIGTLVLLAMLSSLLPRDLRNYFLAVVVVLKRLGPLVGHGRRSRVFSSSGVVVAETPTGIDARIIVGFEGTSTVAGAARIMSAKIASATAPNAAARAVVIIVIMAVVSWHTESSGVSLGHIVVQHTRHLLLPWLNWTVERVMASRQMRLGKYLKGKREICVAADTMNQRNR